MSGQRHRADVDAFATAWPCPQRTLHRRLARHHDSQDTPRDAANFDGIPNKWRDYFSEEPGDGDA
jgi:hypothetical protein